MNSTSEVHGHAVRSARCRVCGASGLRPVLDLGHLPLVDRLIDPDRADEPEPRYPLQFVWCRACTLAQVVHTVPPVELFGQDFPYYSSFSPTFLEHARSYARHTIRERTLGKNSFVLEIASNDGYLLRWFRESGVPVLGIDPAAGPAAAAESIGVPTRVEFFTEDAAERLVSEGVSADLIVANNVVAHVPDPVALLRAAARVLRPGGLITIEAPWVADLVRTMAFDTIYHEHQSYLGVHATRAIAERAGLALVDAERLSVHGGSLRYHLTHASGAPVPKPAVDACLAEERNGGFVDGRAYDEFAERHLDLAGRLVVELEQAIGSGARVAAYGAAAKGVVMLHALEGMGLPHGALEFAVDRNVHKHGKLMPGSRLPIRSVDALMQDRPDVCLVLAWNFAREITNQQSAYLEAGGTFLIPVPEPRYVTRAR